VLGEENHDERPIMKTSTPPLALVGAVAVTAGLTTYLAWPARRSGTSTGKRRALATYLRDHLSLSEIALRMVERLAATQQDAAARALFRRLATEFDEDRAVVRGVLAQLGTSGRSVKRVAGIASGAVVSMSSGGEPGDLSLFRTLEALAVGAQGKRCMWRVLQSIRLPPMPGGGIDFVELEAKAIRQWEAIEERRCSLGPRTFGTGAA
jgi:hypothetical protein